MAVWEIAEVRVAQGREDEFESTFRSLLPILGNADGRLDVKLLRGMDKAGAFLILVEWQSVEHHTEVFRNSEAFSEFSEALGSLLAAPPTPFHAIKVIDGVS